jgi:hypothetical protein
MMKLFVLVLYATLRFCSGSSNATVAGDYTALNTSARMLQTKPPYFIATSGVNPKLGSYSPDAAVGNPLKGLMGSPFYLRPPHGDTVKASLEFFYVGLDKVMIGNPDKVGAVRAFNWTFLEEVLNGSVSRRCHAVLRFILHFPGQVLYIPKHLIEEGVELRRYNKTMFSPYYGDPALLRGMRQFIAALGQKYDGRMKNNLKNLLFTIHGQLTFFFLVSGDRRIACIQLGLLGFWGEWHTFGYPGENLLVRTLFVAAVKIRSSRIIISIHI